MNLDDVKMKTEDVGQDERGRPRIEFLDAKLQRPNWVNDTSRPNGLLWLNKNENIDPVLQEKIKAVFAGVPPYAFNTYPE
ncbi:MAG TPA: hypothetical protein PLU50_09750, partial [Pseudobdellovibrionaceae bacterium]|nr:hypothetical protein [Pseudobdellovibrionaceae bacterium]